MSDIRQDQSEVLHYDFPGFQVFSRFNRNDANEVFPRLSVHWHDELEFAYIVRGRTKHRINDQIITLYEGQGIFINSRQLHLIIADDVDCDLFCLLFHPMIFGGSGYLTNHYVNPITNNAEIPYLILNQDIPWQKDILQNVEAVFYHMNYDNEEPVNGFGVMKDVCGIMEALYQNLSPERAEKTYSDRDLEAIRTMMIFVNNHYAEKIILEQIASSAGLGKTKATALFARYLNMTPMEYVNNFRLDKSISLVEQSDLSITEIAYETGFSDSSYYTKQFKNKLGICPLRHRRAYEEYIRSLSAGVQDADHQKSDL